MAQTEFEKNHPAQLNSFIVELDELIEKYHANLYLLDDVFEGQRQIINAVKEEESRVCDTK